MPPLAGIFFRRMLLRLVRIHGDIAYPRAGATGSPARNGRLKYEHSDMNNPNKYYKSNNYGYIMPFCLPFYRELAATDVMPLVRDPIQMALDIERHFHRGMTIYYENSIYDTIASIRQEQGLGDARGDARVADALNLTSDAVRKIRKNRKITVPNLIAFDVHFGDGRPFSPSRTSIHLAGYIEAVTYARDRLPSKHSRRAWFAWFGKSKQPIAPLTHEVFWTLFYSFSDAALLDTHNVGDDMRQQEALERVILQKDRHIVPGLRTITDYQSIRPILAEYGYAWAICMDVINPSRPVPGLQPTAETKDSIGIPK
jgi:hypothetical protein